MQTLHRTKEVPLNGWILIALLVVAVAAALDIGAGAIGLTGF